MDRARAGRDRPDQTGSNYDPNEFFYRLLRGEGKLERGFNLSVFLISNELLEVDLRLDSRVLSAMDSEEVFFGAYSEADLEAAVERVEATLQTVTNRDIPLLKGTIRAMIDESINSVDAFPQAGRRFGEEVTVLEDRLAELESQMAQFGEIGTERSSKEEKYPAVLTFAANKRTANGKVAVS